MKKTIGIAALVVVGALLAGCTASPTETHGGVAKAVGGFENGREAHGPLEKGGNTVSSVEVTEVAAADGPSLIVTVQMSNGEDVSADAIRKAVADSLAQASSDPSQVELLFVHEADVVDSLEAANEVVPGAEITGGGLILTGDQARSLAG